MADDDEIDILGEFSFNSCFAQNNQGIPSCSDREDTIHPQWLLDSTVNNWYDKKEEKSNRNYKSFPTKGTLKKYFGTGSKVKSQNTHILWSKAERELLAIELKKYGRDIKRLAQTVKTKSEDEIQAYILAEFGVHLDTPCFGFLNEQEDVPAVVQEEIVADETHINNILDLVATGSPTVNVPNHSCRQKTCNLKFKNSIICNNIQSGLTRPSEILYEDDLVIGSTESIGSDLDSTDIVAKKLVKHEMAKTEKKIGNYRRKATRNIHPRPRNKSKDLSNSPQKHQKKDLGLSEEDLQSPKLQIVLGSGQALQVSEGEQVIKIEKKKDSEPESDIDVDIDSGNEIDNSNKDDTVGKYVPTSVEELPLAVPMRKFEPMRKRQRKINLDGGGGYTIMHTESGDLYEMASEPRKERPPKKQPVHLIQCRVYNAERPAPYEVHMYVSALIAMDAHAHTSRGEVMGLVGGAVGAGAGEAPRVELRAYRRAAAAAARTHCDMDPVSQALAAERLRALGLAVAGWHHSHPQFAAAPSRTDLRSQRALQAALERGAAPFLALITSQRWPTGRTASQYRCIRVEEDAGSETDGEDTPVGYQFSVRLEPDLTEASLPRFLRELRAELRAPAARPDEHSVDMLRDVCPQAGRTYLHKCISSISHHMRSAGYADDDVVVKKLIQGVSDVFR